MPQRLTLPTKTQMSADGKRRFAQIDLRSSARGICGHLRQGQATLDYAVFIAVVAAALIAMQVYVRRSIQANLKVLEDQVNAEVR